MDNKLNNPRLVKAAEKFTNLLKDRDPRPEYKDDYRFRVCKKYIHIINSWILFLITSDGFVYPTSRNTPIWHKCIGNVFELIKKPENIKWDGHRDFIFQSKKKLVCSCGRSNNVRKTVLGPRCQYCRGADTRHMNIVRRLGGVPSAYGKPILTKRDYLND